MKLIYRGVTYECHPSETSKHPFQKVRSLLTTEIPDSLAVHQSIYRGVTYVRAHTFADNLCNSTDHIEAFRCSAVVGLRFNLHVSYYLYSSSSSIISRISTNREPKAVNLYSTRGGISG
ncbi:MAG: hypothetical protein N4J56_007182 [Chroococcidiopsis sp. SAG 2025]|uniref:DUF4278 domain-containing protein n=1 Tax=Chroococcidiopsis sp. SAG 2025 TaxID=171389 RepID=UPI002937B1C0|nr:hypothetical protein [Chroococcidiopsis sp. SAG 2025]